MSTYVWRTHRSVFQQTDHGFTWIEQGWLEIDGKRRSAIVPIGGCTERLGTMPGGPLPGEWEELAWLGKRHGFEPWRIRREKTETTHKGFHHVGKVSITPAPERSDSILDGPSDPAPSDSAITLPRNPLRGSCR